MHPCQAGIEVVTSYALRRCARCGDMKKLTDFPVKIGGKRGLRSWCSACDAPIGTEYCYPCRSYKPAEEFAKRYLGQHPKCLACRAKIQRDWKLRKKYGMTLEGYEDFVATQGGVCAICQKDEDLVVDHDHHCCPTSESCGECIRGVLCRQCNSAIGLFGESVGRIAKAVSYLKARSVKR
ncbi:endonuclease domain-containing protein [Streptomyces sp. NPDC087850]|uniref:endonuclease domain-containing protein n=1 Tax=Streptomyces sp. NPDC087850 TaxID=3365809 RepID=UPI0037FB2DF9